jgi:metal iron transporter
MFGTRPGRESDARKAGFFRKMRRKAVKYTKFIGPGFMVSVAYIDPGTRPAPPLLSFPRFLTIGTGNYATDVVAGASYKYRLLFVILMSTLIAIFLQSLCIKLGTVTGLNLAENCRAHLPPWLNYVLYAFAEAAIIATDIAEV